MEDNLYIKPLVNEYFDDYTSTTPITENVSNQNFKLLVKNQFIY